MSSSDLELARALSRLLAEPPAGERPAAGSAFGVPPPDPSRFVRFRQAAAPRGASSAEPPVPAPPPAAASLEPPAVAPGGFGAGVFTPVLEWARRAASADAAFLLGPDGLLVAAVGSLAPDEAEACGARLVVALDQARAMSADGGERTAVSVESGEKVLTAFRVVAPEGIRLTVGLAGAAHVPRAVREALETALAGS